MRKIRALNNDKCLWVSHDLWKKLKTFKVLGINTFEAVGCDACYTAITASLDYGRDRLRVEYHGDNNWTFSIGSSWEYSGREGANLIAQTHNMRKPGWNKS
jgi:hypothetical protein